MHEEIRSYNQAQVPAHAPTCAILADAIDAGLPEAESRIWHAHPVWFLNGNPIVGYSVLKGGVRLLFWSGRSFDEAGLLPEGKFMAAEARYSAEEQVKLEDVARWLDKGRRIQWDYKNLVRRKGKLERLS
jgi:hypothetical protein